ncbi:MobV family relaxase [Halomonas sp. HNIBRBA4712]|uniref:MobV family relaxase n=1 Tax=Halomonas sp. HNIBRBA4712 TaxID=3373087 RepID=UPI003746D031
MDKKYAILRTEKIKSFQASGGSGRHNLRIDQPANADPKRAHLNRFLVTPPNRNLNAGIRARLDECGIEPKWYGNNHKNNSVIAVEVFMGVSPEFFHDKSQSFKDRWVNKNQEWLENKFGRENIVSLILHEDETTTHLQAHIVPITPDGRLSAKDLIGGHKSRHSMLQTEYHKAVEGFGLERGEKNTKREHVPLEHWYKSQNAALRRRTKRPEISDPPLFGRKGWLNKERQKMNAYFKKHEAWRADYMTMLNDPNIRNVAKARYERDKATEQTEKLSNMCNKLLEQKSKIDTEYERYKEVTQKELSAQKETNQRLIEKNRKLRKELEKKNIKNFSHR